MEEEIPQWAKEKAIELTRTQSYRDGRGSWCISAFARYIAEHEEPSVDPLEEILGKICYELGSVFARQIADKPEYRQRMAVTFRREAARYGMKLVKENQHDQ